VGHWDSVWATPKLLSSTSHRCCRALCMDVLCGLFDAVGVKETFGYDSEAVVEHGLLHSYVSGIHLSTKFVGNCVSFTLLFTGSPLLANCHFAVAGGIVDDITTSRWTTPSGQLAIGPAERSRSCSTRRGR